jgi:hypothetical protein
VARRGFSNLTGIRHSTTFFIREVTACAPITLPYVIAGDAMANAVDPIEL